MTAGEAVLVKVLDTKTPLDLGATFTGEVKKVTQVKYALFVN
jgi:hypothetical protein